MERHDRSEYRVLRQTIQTRGTLRPILVLAGFGLWAALLIAVLLLLPFPIAAVIPLTILLVTFEVIRPLHFGAERIGRFIQVFYEEDGQPERALSDMPSWERVTMSFGSIPGTGGHPLFVPIFFLAALVNYLAVLLPRPCADRNGHHSRASPRVCRLAALHRSRHANATGHRARAVPGSFATGS